MNYFLSTNLQLLSLNELLQFKEIPLSLNRLLLLTNLQRIIVNFKWIIFYQ